ncbi:hypothetical protein HOY82DRAFT_609809 [Tuber indicum]|nr:hypothetical protein HOY82DRAFT_609809 [Tuber indicum]
MTPVVKNDKSEEYLFLESKSKRVAFLLRLLDCSISLVTSFFNGFPTLTMMRYLGIVIDGIVCGVTTFTPGHPGEADMILEVHTERHLEEVKDELRVGRTEGLENK